MWSEKWPQSIYTTCIIHYDSFKEIACFETDLKKLIIENQISNEFQKYVKSEKKVSNVLTSTSNWDRHYILVDIELLTNCKIEWKRAEEKQTTEEGAGAATVCLLRIWLDGMCPHRQLSIVEENV